MNTDNLRRITDLRHALHRRPNLSMQEQETVSVLQAFLRSHTTLELCDRDGWFYAVKRGRSEEHPVAFRADMDALPMAEGIDLPYGSVHPGISHKCGHDGHMAALCGLALELERLEVPDTVYLLFQPGEETGQGAIRCKTLIAEKGIKEIYAFHNRSGYPENSLIYRRGLTQPASEGLRMVFHGRASHASAPEEGRNPAAVIAEAVLYAQEMVKEYHQPGQMTLCTVVGMHCGEGDFGISPGEGSVSFTLRSECETIMKEMEQRLICHAKALAEGSGLSMDHEICDAFPETRNHDTAIQRVLEQAERLQLPTIEMKDCWRASEDFGHYLKECAGAMFYIGNGKDYPPLHTAEYDFNDRILETAVDMLTALAVTTLDGHELSYI